ncbi:DUF2207 family protein [Spirilliplanes yamanashiensis]|uniref:Predicted membrane protein YciQ-like C-terminal domain-containing protein n=1 Tax=Spirilliplanes yamanashiensis TaxID=42233 RepID=A0A8J3Y5V0_9ACTN|nr:DUF2207 domain-containing protein [Spirilliplanes yamanashiensis]MDP9814739.1 hypothetical protein [Spirilliplanes yamanashiensis]GIJ02391.1 hypothetical protein Sya03_17430 [Spirilliplanes yamanashiensis]
MSWLPHVAWLVGYVMVVVVVGLAVRLTARLTRPVVPPGTPTPDLIDTPPAVVNLLMNGLADAPDAAPATLLDLAARGRVELFPAGEETRVLVRNRHPGGLTAYERRVLERVTPPGKAEPLTLEEVSRRHAADGHEWQLRLVAEVRQDAQERGLISTGKDNPATWVFIVGLLVLLLPTCGASGSLLMLLGGERVHPLAGLVTMAVLVLALFAVSLVPLMRLGGSARRERFTPEGRRVAGHWAGVAAWLRGHEAFADLPPAAVGLWDRYLAHGVAVSAAPRAAATVDLRTGRVGLVRSTFGGRERLVRVDYPKSTPLRITGMRSALRLATAAAGLAVLAGVVALQRGRADVLPRPVQLSLAAVGALLALWFAYRVVRSLADLVLRRTVTGRVVRLVPCSQYQDPHDLLGSGKDTPPEVPTELRDAEVTRAGEGYAVTYAYFAVLDDGVSDPIGAWWVSPRQAAELRRTPDVVARVEPWSRCLVGCRPHEASSLLRV